jgi:hypothetical protein
MRPARFFVDVGRHHDRYRSLAFPMKFSAPRRCIFCNTTGSSQEHVFPDWLRVLFPRSPADTHNSRTTTWGKARDGKLYAMPAVKEHQGHSGSKKVKYVCQGCNNGWMSRLENRTRPILMKLIQGIPHRISTFDQQILASWVAKTIIVAEFVYPDHTSIAAVERLRMYAATEVGDNWSIWIADYRGYYWRNLAIGHHMCALGPSLTAKPPDPALIAPPDTQFTSIGMGHLFIQAASTTTGIKFGPDDDSTTDLRRIWPATGNDIAWPPVGMLDDRKADFVANSLARITGLPGAYFK